MKRVRFKPSVLEDISNYYPYFVKEGERPDIIAHSEYGNVGFHSDGSPVQIDLSLSFQEIKFQISKDNATGQNLNLSGPVLQAQASQRDANLASLGGQNSTLGGGLGGGNDSFR